MSSEAPDSPERIFAASNLYYDHSDGRRTMHGDEVAVTGIRGENFGIGRLLGNAADEFLGDPSFMPILEVQGARLYGYECWWTDEVEDDLRDLPVTSIKEYLALREAEEAMDDAEDRLLQEEMGVDFDA